MLFIILTFDNISKKLTLLISPRFISYMFVFSESLSQLWVYVSSSLPPFLPICIYLSIYYLQGLNLCINLTGPQGVQQFGQTLFWVFL